MYLSLRDIKSEMNSLFSLYKKSFKNNTLEFKNNTLEFKNNTLEFNKVNI